MTLRPHPLPPVPERRVAAVQAAFPKGNPYVALHAEFGALYDDQFFADLYPPAGCPVEVAPCRLALVMVMQYIEGLTDRQAAAAVRRCIDWKYVLSLDLTDPLESTERSSIIYALTDAKLSRPWEVSNAVVDRVYIIGAGASVANLVTILFISVRNEADCVGLSSVHGYSCSAFHALRVSSGRYAAWLLVERM
jgi:Transposase domain (DUF772)